MRYERLQEIVERFNRLHILVIGDFFLDKYFILDPELSEISLETGLEAYQVADIRCSPGAAGTVASNLRALGAQVSALGVIGDDGEGYDLRCGLQASGTDISGLLIDKERRTPTYAKPMMREKRDRLRELNRLDTKNRRLLPPEAEGHLREILRDKILRADAIIAADQVQEADCGIITAGMREELACLAERFPEKILAADSRKRIGKFRQVIVKPNAREAVGAMQESADVEKRALADRLNDQLDRQEGKYILSEWTPCGTWLQERTGRPVFLTMGAQGILAFQSGGHTHQAALRIDGPIDIVGAGDATMSGIVAALCAGANPDEAAAVGCLASSVTIRQLGTTGTANQTQILQAFHLPKQS